MAFKLRSGNKSPFKNIGSSPAKQGRAQSQVVGEAVKDAVKDMAKEKMQEKETDTPAKQRLTKGGKRVGNRDNQKSPYWYKIDGKKTTRAQYIKYKNVPGNMESGGKQTNDPDVHGRKANNHGRGAKQAKLQPFNPEKLKKAKRGENLLKVVPDEAAFNKLSDIDKKGFTEAGIKAGLPTKKSPATTKVSDEVRVSGGDKTKTNQAKYKRVRATKGSDETKLAAVTEAYGDRGWKVSTDEKGNTRYMDEAGQSPKQVAVSQSKEKQRVKALYIKENKTS